ncbi:MULTISPECIES: MDR family MFS transporter [Priestia]|jgi:EmrB/QacA subfamily drug resistance transporter|uniref:MFS-type drug efflux transporter P55 n=4 Tax=Priestia TaxID=2800373 RepID=D5DZN4_PRIM1|nr:MULTISPECIES: MDR family MFS transporter [Priestia]AIA14796.1 drug resistance MFS transporter, drug:H+ antiporter-2 (14 Spanner) (DHA2) family [uncultured bacterium]AVX09378.1 MFS transporter [Bacillus sp. Y-01]KOP75507.1 multidrug transporter [Bacillus sp. FJAT-21351]KQU12690.1 multidrug transporter [Bacillus sp. Leaf75]KRF56808.1 multidrug transporter [Bacillus sp. Soil531]MBZ5481477.1 MFS transporter [Bacillus sp. T_4]MCF6797316.1 MFS transporter [Bacillus sp. ET1]MDH6653583.1 EmrB/Qa
MENISNVGEQVLNNKNNKILVMTGLMIGIIFSELDETVVNTAMPTIIRDLGGLSMYGWVAGIYMLALSAFMPILGKLADLFSRKKVYFASMAFFIGGSIICGLSHSMIMLLIGRGIQGLGAGGLMPLAMTISSDLFPVEQRAKVQAFMGPVMFIPMLLGPLMGGFFVDQASWHWIFFVNIPVGLIAVIFLASGLKEVHERKKVTIDWAGAILLVAAIISLLITPVLVENEGYTWSSPFIVSLLCVGVILIGLFIWVESKVIEPIVPLHLFRNRNILVLSLLVFTVGCGLMGSFSSFPYFAQNVLGLTPTESGYLTLPMMVGAVATSIVSGFLLTKVRYRELFVISFIMPVIGFYLFSKLDISTTTLQVIIFFFITGLGLGVMFGGDNLIVQESVEKEHKGIALATVPLFQSIGATVGVSMFGTLLSSTLTSNLSSLGDELPKSMANNMNSLAAGGIPSGLTPELFMKIKVLFIESFQHIYTYAFVLTIIAFVLCFFLKKEVLSSKSEE